jgi:hypothetical protein
MENERHPPCDSPPVMDRSEAMKSKEKFKDEWNGRHIL